MATLTEGGLDPTSQYNIGSTSRKVQAAASESTSTQTVKDMLLAKNYVPSGVSSNAAEFDTRLADWYRHGKPSTSKDRVYDRLPKIIEPLDNEEPAALRVFGRSKKNAKSGDVELIPPFTKFILESMNEGHAERSQIVETFGTFYVFLFGERPPTYSFTGTLINSKDINWRTDFQFYYDNYLRGTRCVDSSARLVMTYGGRQIEGFMINFQTMTDASAEMGVKVSFQVVVTSRMSTLNRSIDFGVLNKDGVQTSDATITNLLKDIAGAEGKSLSRPDVNQAYQEAAATLAGGPSSGPVQRGVTQALIA